MGLILRLGGVYETRGDSIIKASRLVDLQKLLSSLDDLITER